MPKTKNDITIKREWMKNCPECDKEQIYNRRDNLMTAIRNNIICRNCAHPKQEILIKLEKTCPECGNIQKYGNIKTFNTAVKRSCKCRSCSIFRIKVPDNLERLCSSCDNKIKYKSVHFLNTAIKNNYNCRSCGLKGNGGSREYYKNNPLARIEASNRAKIQMMIKYGHKSYEDYLKTLPEREKYYREVKLITRKQSLYLLENFDKPRRKSGIEGAYHLDHIYPISKGFENNIDPNVIGNINNLQFITWEENIKKGNKI